MQEKLLKIFNADNSYVGYERGLSEIFFRDIYLGNVSDTGSFDDVNNSVNGAQGTIERKFADEEFVLKVFLAKLARENKNREGDG